MAEILIRAKTHWKDAWTLEQINKLAPEQKQSYEVRSQIGDIIVVRPDGWKWGKEECPPHFIVLKVPELKYVDAKKYEESLIDDKDPENPIMIKVRKYAVDIDTVNTCALEVKGQKEMAESIFDSKLITKTE